MLAFTRRELLGAGALWLAGRPAISLADANILRVFVGTFTNASGENVSTEFGKRAGDQLSRGIYSFTFDISSGRAGDIKLAAEVTNPVNMITHSNGRFLYACRGQATRIEGQNIITAFAIEGDTLRELNTVRSGGGGPTVGVVDKTGRNLLTTNFSTNSIVCFRLNEDGSLGERSALIGKEPSGPIPNLPPSPASGPNGMGAGGPPPNIGKDATKPHAIVLSKTQRYAIAAEITANRCHVLRFDADKGTLETHQLAAAMPESGPRHLAWHPSYRYLYTSGEEGSCVSAWTWDENKGELKTFQNLSTLPDGFQGSNNPADIEMHPSGKFVYVTNRGTGTLAGFSIDQRNGALTAIGQAEVGSPSSWSMLFTPNGKWALAAAQLSDEVIIYSVDQTTGLLRQTGQKLKVVLPSCLRWGERS